MIYDKGKVIAGIIVFILIVAFPVYYNIAKPREQARPSLDTPVINQMGVKQCVMPKDYMTTEHMQLLDDGVTVLSETETVIMKKWLTVRFMKRVFRTHACTAIPTKRSFAMNVTNTPQ